MKRDQLAIITLTTDFGQRDGYVASMKGVIWRIAPQATIVDVTHQVDGHQVLPTAFVLRQVVAWYPPGTVHVAVVDPGVGTDRRIIAARFAGQYFVAPDNGDGSPSTASRSAGYAARTARSLPARRWR